MFHWIVSAKRKNMAKDYFSLFINMLRNPSEVGAIVPSSKGLGRKMVAAIENRKANIVELGPGTGPITRQIIQSGIAPENLTLVEMNTNFASKLAREFPNANVLNAMAQTLPDSGLENVGTVVSSLPLLNIPLDIQRQIISSVFSVLNDDGILVQFTYGFKPPIAPELIQEFDLVWENSGRVWFNLPPAQVYVFKQNRIA